MTTWHPKFLEQAGPQKAINQHKADHQQQNMQKE